MKAKKAVSGGGPRERRSARMSVSSLVPRMCTCVFRVCPGEIINVCEEKKVGTQFSQNL